MARLHDMGRCHSTQSKNCYNNNVYKELFQTSEQSLQPNILNVHLII